MQVKYLNYACLKVGLLYATVDKNMIYMPKEPEKKNLNWKIATPLADRMMEVVRERHDAKKMWLCAAAAVLMYLDADDETKDRYEAEAFSAAKPEAAKRALASRSRAPRGIKSRGKK